MPLNPLWMDEIVAALRAGKCVPFLGAAANISCNGYEGLPLGMHVSESLAKHLAGETIADKTNLPRVSFVYEQMVFRSGLLGKLKNLIPDRQRKPSRLLQVLASLPFDLYITTNYDRLLEEALTPRKPIVVVQTTDHIEGVEMIAEWAEAPAEKRRPLVYKFHGTFKDPTAGQPDTSPVIVTEDDYIGFLTLFGKPDHALPNVLTSRLGISTLLFLGYGLEDWDVRILYKTLLSNDLEPFRPASYSVQKGAADFWRDYWNRRNIKILNADVYEFADELANLWGAKENGGAP